MVYLLKVVIFYIQMFQTTNQPTDPHHFRANATGTALGMTPIGDLPTSLGHCGLNIGICTMYYITHVLLGFA